MDKAGFCLGGSAWWFCIATVIRHLGICNRMTRNEMSSRLERWFVCDGESNKNEGEQ
jgi:hypothetical protein